MSPEAKTNTNIRRVRENAWRPLAAGVVLASSLLIHEKKRSFDIVEESAPIVQELAVNQLLFLEGETMVDRYVLPRYIDTPDTSEAIYGPAQIELPVEEPVIEEEVYVQEEGVYVEEIEEILPEPSVSGADLGYVTPVSSYPSIDVPDSRWDQVAHCESTSDWSINNGNGFYGGLQFTYSTWLEYGGGEFAQTANFATREQQIIVAERVLAGQGWGAWPNC